MSEQHPLEPAARLLCQMRDLDPDRKLHVPHPMGLAPYVVKPQWLVLVDELLAFSQCLSALHTTAMRNMPQGPSEPLPTVN